MGEIRRFYSDFLDRTLGEYQEYTPKTSPRVGVGVAFFVSVFRPTREAHMADSIAVDSPVDVGINEMFRQLRSGQPTG